MIENAERFGLAQLHQLRGRVGRGDAQSYAIFVTENTSEKNMKRLGLLSKTNDGFEISFEDLKLRGPGDILGTRQSGLPAFILGNLIEDTKFVEAAKTYAHYICDNLKIEENRQYYDNIALIASQNYID